jgi:hypothetical protein
MGLDFSHGEAHWAYSGFARFREKLAKQVGIDDYEKITNTNDPKLEAIKKDGIHPLLAHSDCDGKLTIKEMKKVIPRLEELIKNWSSENPRDEYDLRHAKLLIEGMKEAVSEKQQLEFR